MFWLHELGKEDARLTRANRVAKVEVFVPYEAVTDYKNIFDEYRAKAIESLRASLTAAMETMR